MSDLLISRYIEIQMMIHTHQVTQDRWDEESIMKIFKETKRNIIFHNVHVLLQFSYNIRVCQISRLNIDVITISPGQFPLLNMYLFSIKVSRFHTYAVVQKYSGTCSLLTRWILITKLWIHQTAVIFFPFQYINA